MFPETKYQQTDFNVTEAGSVSQLSVDQFVFYAEGAQKMRYAVGPSVKRLWSWSVVQLCLPDLRSKYRPYDDDNGPVVSILGNGSTLLAAYSRMVEIPALSPSESIDAQQLIFSTWSSLENHCDLEGYFTTRLKPFLHEGHMSPYGFREFNFLRAGSPRLKVVANIQEDAWKDQLSLTYVPDLRDARPSKIGTFCRRADSWIYEPATKVPLYVQQ